METTVKSTKTHTVQHVKKQEHASPGKFWDMMEFSRFGAIAMIVIIIGCLGGIAASFGAGDNIFKLAMVAFPTIIALAMVLAVAPMRLIVYVSIIALLLDLMVLVF
jgi:hypothetical protein